MIQTRSYFTSGADGASGILFRKYNRPLATAFYDLFESQLFKLESADRATLNANGHARIADAAHIISRSDTYFGVAATRFTLATHLPDVCATLNANHTVDSTDTAYGITINSLTLDNGSGTDIRKDFQIMSDVTLASADGSFTITEAPAGSKHFEIAIDLTNSWIYKVKVSAGVGTPGYLTSVCNTNHFYQDMATTLSIRYIDSTSIDISDSALGITAAVIFNNIGLQAVAGGVEIRDNIDTIAFTTTYVRTAGGQTIAGLKQFTTYPQWSGAYVAPTIDNELAPKKYVDDLDVLCVHLAGAETITGAKIFSLYPQIVNHLVLPVNNADFATKWYVDQLYGAGLGIWELDGAATHAIQSLNTASGCLATGDYCFAVGHDSEATAQYAVAIGNTTHVHAASSFAMGNNNTVTGAASYAFGIGSNVSGNASCSIGGNSITNTDGYAVGIGNTISALGGHVFGQDSKASVAYANVFGLTAASATLAGSFAFGRLFNSVVGDRQEIFTFLNGSTIGAVSVDLVDTISSSGILIPTDCSANVIIRLVGVQTNNGGGTVIGDTYSQIIKLAVNNVAGVSAVVPTAAVTLANYSVVAGNIIYEIPFMTAGWGSTVAVTVAANKIQVTPTGEAAKNINWFAKVSLVWMGHTNFSI